MKDLSTFFLVGSGGFLGANARYWLGSWIHNRFGPAFPWQTLVINVSGSLIMGLFMGLVSSQSWNDNWKLFFAIGVLGGYTTFSSFSYETVQLFNQRSYFYAFCYILGSVVFTVLAAWLGFLFARLFVANHA